MSQATTRKPIQNLQIVGVADESSVARQMRISPILDLAGERLAGAVVGALTEMRGRGNCARGEDHPVLSGSFGIMTIRAEWIRSSVPAPLTPIQWGGAARPGSK